MGSYRRGWFATFRGEGPVPQGAVRWSVVERSGSERQPTDASRLEERIVVSPPKEAQVAESDRLQIAKITARKAVIVAVITAISGILVGIVSGYQSGRSAQADTKQHWITLKPVVAEPFEVGSAVRVIVLANSQAYSYPSRAVWADIGPRMSRETFPLPVDTAEYRFRFEVFYRRADGSKVLYTSQEVHEISTSEISKTSPRPTWTDWPQSGSELRRSAVNRREWPAG